MSYEDMRRKESLEDKKKWFVKSGFISTVGKSAVKKPAYIPNYVNLSPSEPPLNYQFREIKKTKWVGQRGFY